VGSSLDFDRKLEAIINHAIVADSKTIDPLTIDKEAIKNIKKVMYEELDLENILREFGSSVSGGKGNA